MTHNAFTTNQTNFRGRNDDGTESAATWKAANNTNWTQTVNENFRVRFVVAETGGDTGSNNVNFKLQYNRLSAGWNDVNASSQVARTVNSVHVSDGTTTTQQVGAGTFITPNNGFDDIDGATNGVDIDFVGGDEVEVEFCLILLAADVANDDTIQFRVIQSNGTLLDAWSQTPTVTVTGIPPTAITQSAFRIRTDDEDGLNAAWDVAHPLLNSSASVYPDTRVRVRFVVGADAALTDGFELRASINAGAYTAVPSDIHHFGPGLTMTERVVAVPSDQYVDLAATTQVIGTGTFVAGVGCETGLSSEITFAANEETEIEYCFVTHKIGGGGVNIEPGDTIDFRLYRDNGQPLDTYTFTPRLTISNRPGWIGTTAPEMGGDFGPFVDGNNNVYVVSEESEWDNTPTVMKSVDNGVTWTEQTRVGAPTRLDMEGCHAVLVGDTITIFHREGSDRLNAHQFHVSTHATTPDAWGTVDDIVASAATLGPKVNSIDSVGAGWRSSTSDFVVAVHGSNGGDGTTWAISGVVGSWDTPVEVDTSHGADDMGACQLVVGENDVGHVFYINNTDGVLYHKTIAADATVTATSLTPAQGTAGNTVATNLQVAVADAGAVYTPVYWMDAGVEKVAIGWHSSTAHMFVNVMHDGTWQGQQQASDAIVADDTADHQGAWSGLVVVDPTTDDLRAYFIDNSDNSLWLEATNADPLTTFGTPTTFKDSSVEAGQDEARTGGTAGWDVIWGKQITHGGGSVFGLLGSWARGGTGLQYYEISLSTGTNVAVGLATETDTALPATAVTGALAVAVGVATETDSALPATAAAGALTVAVGLATETDSALPVTAATGATNVAVGLATETDSALPATAVAGALTVAVGVATETDTALPATPAAGPVAVSIAVATETDTALPVTATSGIVVAVGLATETDTALPVTVVTGALTIAVGLATETDTALPVTATQGLVVAVGLATETDTALSVTAAAGALTVAVGLATETDTALPATPLAGIVVAVGVATETDSALPVAIIGDIVVSVGLATETDSALPVALVSGDIIVSVGLASETDTALAATVELGQLLGVATETDSALAVTALVGPAFVVIGLATETDTALPVTSIDKSFTDWSPDVSKAQSLIRVRPAQSTDTYNNVVYDYGPGADRVSFIGWLQQDVRQEYFPDGRDPLEERWLLITNFVNIFGVDQIEWLDHPAGAVTFTVHGPPEPAYRPGGIHHIEATLRKVAG